MPNGPWSHRPHTVGPCQLADDLVWLVSAHRWWTSWPVTGWP